METEAKKQNTNRPQNQTEQTEKKAPEQWKTGNQPMTASQAAYLKTLCEKTGQEFDPTLTKAAASKRIEELKANRN